ncbi:hypothetical protein TNIN_247591, partial [Trichonephila inaurata madagascariensis]
DGDGIVGENMMLFNCEEHGRKDEHPHLMMSLPESACR